MNQCGDSTRVVHPLFQTEDGGSTPTSPLHLEIAEVDIKTAQQLNELWHSVLPVTDYSNLTRTKHKVAFAAFFENKYYASAIWTDPVARMLNDKGWLELRRMAIAPDAPANTGTRMLKIMRLKIRSKWRHLERLISYQDTEAHAGTIYKAGGWKSTTKSSVSGTGWNSRKRAKMQTTADKIRWEINL